MSELLGCGHPDKNRACGDCLGEAVEAIERARTFTGLEAEGCPLCTYVEGVFTASCSFHQKLEAANLQLRAMVEERDLYSDVVDAAKLWLKHHGEVSHSTYYLALKYQVERLGSKVTEKPKCGLCGGQDNHDGGCIPDTI